MTKAIRVSYINENGALAHKGFADTKSACAWANTTANITPCKLLAWNDDIDCFATVLDFRA